jgi:hypothetical protein
MRDMVPPYGGGGRGSGDDRGDGGLLTHDDPPVLSFEVRDSNVVFPRIGPEQLSCHIINCKSVWPTEGFCDQNSGIAPIHPSLADVRTVSPISPVKITLEGVYDDCSGFLEVVFDEDLPISSLQS